MLEEDLALNNHGQWEAFAPQALLTYLCRHLVRLFQLKPGLCQQRYDGCCPTSRNHHQVSFSRRDVLQALSHPFVVRLRVATQILPSGQMPQETARTKGASYSMYNLEVGSSLRGQLCFYTTTPQSAIPPQAFAHVAVLASYSNVSLWSYQAPGNRSLRQALDFLLPFATGEAVWPYS